MDHEKAPEQSNGEAFTPVIPASQSIAEVTWKAVILGIIISVVFGVANAYLGLKFGMTVSASIPATGGGEAHSAEAVRHRIKQLIDDEAPEDVLSDDQIVEILTGFGIEIARRTVAKYRESLNIPSSVQRRRMGKAG